MSAGDVHVVSAYGVSLELDFMPPGLHPTQAPREVKVERADARALDRAWSGTTEDPVWATSFGDDPYRVETGTDGDHLFTYAEVAQFHLSAELDRLLCWVAPGAPRRWERVFLDDVLHGVSALRGFPLLHCSAIETPAGVLAFAARMGGGKTSLACELLRRGHGFFCDDLLALGRSKRGLTAYPGPTVMNLPASLVDAATRELGARELAALPDGEVWVSLPEPPAPARELAAFFVFERVPGAATVSSTIAATVVDLLAFSVGFPHLSHQRAARFEILSDLAASVPIHLLRVDTHASPAAIADLVEQALTMERTQAREPVAR